MWLLALAALHTALTALSRVEGLSLDMGSCEASSNVNFCSYAFDKNLSSAWASSGPAPQWVEGRIAGGIYASLGSYTLISVPGNPNLAPTAWRLEGVEPYTETRQTLDEVTGHIWYDGDAAIRNLGGLSSWRSYQLTMLQGLGTQLAIAELQLMPKMGYTFELSDWNPCSVTCGGGTQDRNVTCKGSDGVSYSDNRCTTGEPPLRSRVCGTGICACEGGLACGASCTASSTATADLGCIVAVDGAVLSAWTSGAPPPQWLEYDLGKVRTLEKFTITSGVCTVCHLQEGPSIISLQATNQGPEISGRSWLELRQPFSVGSVWSSGETRRFNLPEGSAAFRYWRLNFHETFGAGGTVYKVHVAEVGLFGPPTEFRLSVGPWQECEPLGGTYACGDGISRRTVQCYDDENYPQALENCENGPETVTEKGCSLDCPLLQIEGATAHPEFFGILRVTLTAQWMAKILCAAYQVPMTSDPSSGELDGALYKGIGYADDNNGTTDVDGILVTRFAGEEFEVRCKVVGGSLTFGTGRRAVLRLVPLLMGCYADSFSARDLPEYQGVQTQLSCADACFGSQYFGIQMRGKCFCGDTYGRYGVKLPNKTAGLTGCDCNGPYFAYEANCVWEQTTGRFGDETMLPLRVQSVSSNSAQILALVEADARIRCNVTAAGATSAPSTSASCANQGCTLSMGNLEASTTYTLLCRAEANDGHRSERLASLLLRTLDPALPPITATPTRAPLDLSEPYYVLSTTRPPLIQIPHGVAPWDWLWVPTTLIGGLALGFAIHCCARGKNAMVLESLDLPHTFWLIWELLLVVDLSLGVGLLLDILHGRFEREAPYWDVLGVVQASVLCFEAAIHGAAFLGFGALPALARILATQVLKRRSGNSWTLHRYKGVQHRLGSRQQQSALPPELDTDQNPSPLHYLPGASLWAVCRASSHDLELVIPYKVGINSFHFLGSVVQFFCASFFVSHPWEGAVSLGVAISSMCFTLLLAIVMALALMRAHHVASSGLVRLAPEELGTLRVAAAGSTGPSAAPPRVGLKGAPSAKAPRSLGKAQTQRRT